MSKRKNISVCHLAEQDFLMTIFFVKKKYRPCSLSAAKLATLYETLSAGLSQRERFSVVTIKHE